MSAHVCTYTMLHGFSTKTWSERTYGYSCRCPQTSHLHLGDHSCRLQRGWPKHDCCRLSHNLQDLDYISAPPAWAVPTPRSLQLGAPQAMVVAGPTYHPTGATVVVAVAHQQHGSLAAAAPHQYGGSRDSSTSSCCLQSSHSSWAKRRIQPVHGMRELLQASCAS